MDAQSAPAYKLAVPDVNFRLSPVERGKVRLGFDPEALERLLARLVPDVRSDILDAFQQPPPDETARLIVELKDPELNALLDEVASHVGTGFAKIARHGNKTLPRPTVGT